MANQYCNKVVLEGGEVLIDLTSDTVVANKILSGYTAHDKTGAPITGSCAYDSNTTDATAAASEILNGKTAYINKTKVTGAMVNNGKVTGSISTKAGKYTIPVGYHDGSGTVGISSTEQAKLVATNIREGVTILGVLGTMSGSEGEIPEVGKTVTPTFSAQTIVPSTGYTCFQQIEVQAIPVSRADNAAGGVTVTIG